MLLSDADANVVHFLDYLTGSILTQKSIELIAEATDYNPLTQPLRDTQNLPTFNKYLTMETPRCGTEHLNTLNINNPNECWLNVLYENYSTTLLRPVSYTHLTLPTKA